VQTPCFAMPERCLSPLLGRGKVEDADGGTYGVEAIRLKGGALFRGAFQDVER
jgi:hypothetical protein